MMNPVVHFEMPYRDRDRAARFGHGDIPIQRFKIGAVIQLLCKPGHQGKIAEAADKAVGGLGRQGKRHGQ